MADDSDGDINAKDIENALNPTRSRKKLTKEQQIYGIWAEDDDEHKESTHNRKKTHSNFNKKSKDTTNNKEEGKFGQWEKHTSGFGSKMLEKMGFVQGKGLGKKGTGIKEPIKAQVRPGRATLGAYGFENQNITPKPSPSTEKPKSPVVNVPGWHKNQKSTNRYIKKSFEQLIKETNDVPVKIIDMTTAETKVTFGYNSINLSEKTTSNFDVPELRHNVSLLNQFHENQVKSYLKRLKIKKDLVDNFRTEQKSILDTSAHLQTENENLYKLVEILENLKLLFATSRDDYQKLKILLNTIDIVDFNYFHTFKLDGLIGSMFYPLVYELLAPERLLSDYSSILEIFKLYKSVLKNAYKNDEIYDLELSKRIFEKTVKELVLPSVVELLKAYDTSSPSPLLHLYDSWSIIFFDDIDSMFKHVLLNTIQIQLETRQFSNWNDLNYVKQYEVMFRSDMSEIYKTLIKKLFKVHCNWNPLDSSIRDSLLWFQQLLSPEQVLSIFTKLMAPKLSQYLDDKLVINPKNQKLDELMNVLQWNDLLGSKMTSIIISKSFSTKWLNVLLLWLNSNPTYPDVQRWYNGWKSFFKDLISEPPIQSIFNQALIMIEQSINGETVDSPQTFVPKIHTEIKEKPRVSLTFKELLQSMASDNSLMFTPTSRNRPDGKTIYKFGSKAIYIDRDVVFVNMGQEWRPISVQELVRISA